MAKGNVTTVTHPDGTISKRTSQSRIYTHAVVIARTRQSLVDDQLAEAARDDERARVARSAIDGKVTSESRSWSGGKQYITLFVGGEYAGAHVSDQPRPTDEELRDQLRKWAADAEGNARRHRDKAAELARGPEVDYGVLRWSSRADLAHKAASGEYGSLIRPGVTIDVVAVD